MQQVVDSISQQQRSAQAIRPIKTTLWELTKSINGEVKHAHDHLVAEIVSDILIKNRVRLLRESLLSLK